MAAHGLDFKDMYHVIHFQVPINERCGVAGLAELAKSTTHLIFEVSMDESMRMDKC